MYVLDVRQYDLGGVPESALHSAHLFPGRARQGVRLPPRQGPDPDWQVYPVQTG